MPRRFRRGRRFNRRAARAFVRRTVRSMGRVVAKRVLMDALDVTDSTTVNLYDTDPTKRRLLVCQETQDEELESDGTNVATAPINARVVSMRLNCHVGTMSAAERIRWMVMKRPDGENLATTTLMAARFHDSADDATSRELRALVLAKGIIIGSDKTAGRIPIFIKRQALKRNGHLRENDDLVFVIESNLTGSTAVFTMWGTIYVREPSG